MAAFMDIIASLGFFFAVEEWQIYAGSYLGYYLFCMHVVLISSHTLTILCLYAVAPVLDIFHGVALATCYSLASKFFTEEDFGE